MAPIFVHPCGIGVTIRRGPSDSPETMAISWRSVVVHTYFRQKRVRASAIPSFDKLTVERDVCQRFEISTAASIHHRSSDMAIQHLENLTGSIPALSSYRRVESVRFPVFGYELA